MIRRRLVVRGRVQGVFFRDTVRRLAISRSVAGWVGNRPDGAVEVVLEGREDPVESMVSFCREGPPDARVDEIEVTEEDPEGIDGFEVRG